MNSAMTHLIILYSAIMVALLFVLTVATMVWVKLVARGKVAGVFIDTRRIYSTLLPEDTIHNCIWRGAESNPNREKYKLTPDKVFEIKWPGGLPWFMQERMRAWLFVRNNDEPWDPSNMRIVMSGRMNRMISDEALLKTMWTDLRKSTGASGGSASMSMPMLLFLGMIALVCGVGVIMTYNLGKKIDTEYSLLLQIYRLLGGM